MMLTVFAGLLLASGAPETVSTAAANPPTIPPVEEKKVCRRQIETGSLVKGKKLCFTAKQWQKISDNSRDEVERTASMGSASGQ